MEDATYGYMGEGGNTSGVETNCGAPNAYTELCGNPEGSEGGGASWRIFSVYNPEGLRNKDNGYYYENHILTGTEGVFAEIRRECGHTGWFVSFGWDGMRANDTYQIGPAKHGKGLIESADYNRYSAKTLDEIKADINNKSIQNNTKIYPTTAKRLFQSIYNTANIPDNVGFFCFDPEKVVGKEYNLTAIAIDEEGHMLDKDGNGLTNSFSRAELAVETCKEGENCSISVKRELNLGSSGGAKFLRWQSQTIQNSEAVVYFQSDKDEENPRPGVLDVFDGKTGNTTEIWLYPAWEKTNANKGRLEAQKWQLIKSKNNDYYMIANTKSGRLIDAKNGETKDIWIVSNNRTGAQRWHLDDDSLSIKNGIKTRIRSDLDKNKVISTSGVYNGTSSKDNVFLESVDYRNNKQLWTVSNNIEGTNNKYTRVGGALTGDGYAFAVYKTPDYNFTVNFMDTKGRIIKPKVDMKVKYGGTATYTADGIANYVFRGWKARGVCAGRLNGDGYLDRLSPVCEDGTRDKGYYLTNNKNTYNYMNVTNDLTVNAIYELVGFKGKTSVSGDATGVAGFTNVDDPKSISKSVFTTKNCSPVTGCKVTFSHDLQRSVNNLGSTKYTVSRTSNLTTGTRGVKAGNIKANQTFNTNGGTVSSSNLTLYPGMVVCERLTFKPNQLLLTKDIYTEVCVKAIGDSQCDPNDPACKPEPCAEGDAECPRDKDERNSIDPALLNIKVRNKNVDKFKAYQGVVYAKPTDEVAYRASYNPILQYTYFLAPEKMRIDGGTIFPASSVNKTTLMYNLFNANKGNLKNWNNDFSVKSSNFEVPYDKNFSFANGNTSLRVKINNYKVKMGEVGIPLRETALTNLNEETQTTPSQVQFRNINNFDTGNVITRRIESSAEVRVPYNFVNRTEVTSDENTTIFYAGESASINFKVIVEPKTNSITTNDSTFKYATKVDSGRYKINLCIGGSFRTGCSRSIEAEEASLGKQLSISPEKMMKGDVFNRQTSINIPDEPAGTLLCARSMVYPANSGRDDNWNDREGSHTWAYSEEKCYKIAKKPSIQVWGGNIYTRGDITTLTSNKNNLAGYAPYKVSGNTDYNRSFGSWGELGIIADGKVVGLASGASLGYSSNIGGDLRANPGGNTSNKYCDHSPLSFANANCGSGIVGFIGSKVAQGVVEKETDSIMSKFGPKSGDKERYKVSGSITLENDNPERINDRNIYYYDGGSNNISISESTVNANRIQVVRSDKDITIEGNLKYADVAYNLLAKDSKVSGAIVPKLVIMAKNININCGVNQVDALLVAEETVDTCSNSDNIKNRENSNWLKINGAIVAKKLIANRTYGASTGKYSIIPAEIINFDQSLLLWGALGNSDSSGDGSGGASDTDGSGGRNYLDVTYTRELAPRF